MSPDPKALAVLLDAARACYGDDSEQVRWLLNPEAVRELLKHTPLHSDMDGLESCTSCDQVSEGEAHFADCPVAAAWRALGDPRGAQDIERAETEAWQHHVGRADWAPSLGRCFTAAELSRMPKYAMKPANWSPEFVERVRAFGEAQTLTEGLLRLSGAAQGAAEAAGAFRLASESQQAAQHRAILEGGIAAGARVAEQQAWAQLREPGRPLRVLRDQERADSDARGMEAVEDEARAIDDGLAYGRRADEAR